ncbi:MAG: phage holin family protein [Ferruginibacter sp.]
MENTFATIEELAGNVKEYLHTQLESVKLKTAEKSSLLVSNILAGIAVVAVFLFFIVFSGFALAYGLGALTGKVWLGFLLVALLFFLLGAIVWWGREKLIRLPLMNAFIKQLFNSKEDED